MQRRDLVARLKLQADRVDGRLGPKALGESLKASGTSACLILPTARARDVARVNREALASVQNLDAFYTAGTLHPLYRGNREELDFFMANGIRGIKLCSFSQGFSLEDPATLEMFDLIQSYNLDSYNRGSCNQNPYNRDRKAGFFVILDTLYRAHRYFGTDPQHDTRPDILGRTVRNFPGITFIAAHMGGLAAPFDQLREHLPAADNLYLDTSNAPRLLSQEEMVYLLKTHGPRRMVFGTDWPWFSQKGEIPLIGRLLNRAGFSPREAARVWSGNIARLLQGRAHGN